MCLLCGGGQTVGAFDVDVVRFLDQMGDARRAVGGENDLAVVYRGPFKKVEDDDDHVYYRGERMAVCDKTFRLLQNEPYGDQFEFVEPLETVPLEKAERFDCSHPKHRHPRETKGLKYDVTTEDHGQCTDGDNCC